MVSINRSRQLFNSGLWRFLFVLPKNKDVNILLLVSYTVFEPYSKRFFSSARKVLYLSRKIKKWKPVTDGLCFIFSVNE